MHQTSLSEQAWPWKNANINNTTTRPSALEQPKETTIILPVKMAMYQVSHTTKSYLSVYLTLHKPKVKIISMLMHNVINTW